MSQTPKETFEDLPKPSVVVLKSCPRPTQAARLSGTSGCPHPCLTSRGGWLCTSTVATTQEHKMLLYVPRCVMYRNPWPEGFISEPTEPNDGAVKFF